MNVSPHRALATLIGLGAVLGLPAAAGPLTSAPATTPTPTVDRLAAPPTVVSPTQADEGAQLFWLYCQPCHGDRGQGLTREWRAQYPPEDQNCWASRCHGKNPEVSGFSIPHIVPAIVGPETLGRFATAADLHAFIVENMPYEAPGTLTPEAYWALTAFLLRGNGHRTSAAPIEDEAQARRIVLNPSRLALDAAAGRRPLAWAGLGTGVVCLIGVGFVAWRRRGAGTR